MGDNFNRLQHLFSLLDMKSQIEAMPPGPQKTYLKWEWLDLMRWVINHGRDRAAA